jgi:two-component system, LuxR family, response regulator FixJ
MLRQTEERREVMTASRELFIVDDDPAVRNALSMVFSRDGFHVSDFEAGNSFLSAARARLPACIILDVQMPGRSGLDILKEPNAEIYGAPIFFVSEPADIPTAVDAIKLGALDSTEKPLDDTLVARVSDAIAAWEQRAAKTESNDPLKPFPNSERRTKCELDVLALIASGKAKPRRGGML